MRERDHSRHALRDRKVLALGQDTRSVARRDQVDAPLLAGLQVGTRSVDVRVVGRLDVLRDGDWGVGGRGVDKLDREVGGVGRDGLQGQ